VCTLTFVTPHPKPESDSELRARALLEAEFGCALERIREDPRVPTADYRTIDGSRSVEVKRITSEAHNELRNMASRTNWSYDSSILSGRWTVMIRQPTLSEILSPMPKFPADDPEASAEAEVFGFRLIPRHEREAEWRASHPGRKRSTPRLKGLGPDLERHLQVLEQHAIYNTRGAWPSDPDAWQARCLVAIATRRFRSFNRGSRSAKRPCSARKESSSLVLTMLIISRTDHLNGDDTPCIQEITRLD